MSFFRYPGGKKKLSTQIVETLKREAPTGNYQYREPFFGGGTIAFEYLNTYGINDIWINDKDFGVASLWTAVIRYPDDLKDQVKRFLPHTDHFYDYQKYLVQDKEMGKSADEIISDGFKKLVIHQISYSGLGTKSGGPLGGRSQESQYTVDCRWSPAYICKKIDHFHNLFNWLNIKDNMCTNLDFEVLIDDTEKPSLIYLDPPYYLKGNELYQFGFNEDDHRRLRDSLRRTSHSWALSYDDCLPIRNYYNQEAIEVISASYTIKGARNKNEFLITRG